MNKLIYALFNSITRGIILLNERFEIEFINEYMRNIIDLSQDEALGKNIFQLFSRLNTDYFKDAFHISLVNSYRYFFSSKIHRDIIAKGLEINFNISGLEINGERILLMEFIDITSQSQRIDQLKEYLNELSYLNNKLQEKEREIEKLVYSDCLTRVGNRALFYSLAEKFLAAAKRNNRILALIFIDVDDLKRINDTYGHALGDQALIEIAKVLTENVREADAVFRYGGDEFIILLPELTSFEDYKAIAQRIQKAGGNINTPDNRQLSTNLSMGVSFYPRDGMTIDQLLLKADQAMYKAKQAGGNKK